MVHQVIVLALLVSACSALDNGLARTPPMGWLSWERFRCNTDCENDPDNCIGEKLFKEMADRMAADGFKDAGYEYVNIDDCWLSKERDASGRLQADPKRFPNGIKGLADYVHSKGLKLGIYEDFGTKTCGGYPGSEYYLQLDAQTFADWNVDYLKLDGCYSDPHQYDDGYPPIEFFLNMTGRDIVYSCEFPLHQIVKGIKPNYQRVSNACNLARNYNDIQDSMDSFLSIVEYYGDDTGNFAEQARPGFWNDPDMLIIGNFGLSYDQARAQMALWTIMASPLIMSTDLRNIRPEAKELLLNKRAIAVNQDPMGKQGRRINKMGSIQVWTKPILPAGSMAFAFLNTGTGGTPTKVSLTMANLGLNGNSFSVMEVFDGKMMGNFKMNDTFAAYVNPTGVFYGLAKRLS